jgi:ribosomal protein L37AE/L43A
MSDNPFRTQMTNKHCGICGNAYSRWVFAFGIYWCEKCAIKLKNLTYLEVVYLDSDKR